MKFLTIKLVFFSPGIIWKVLVFILFLKTNLLSWHNKTHLAIAKAAGYAGWYHAAGADIARIKAGNFENFNHWFNNPKNLNVTIKMVLEQVKRYNDPRDGDGHLYGAIIGSIRAFKESRIQKKYADYHIAYCAHYIGDLSQPFHNIPHDEFNKSRHITNDNTLESEVSRNIEKIKKNMYAINLRPDNFERELARHIARIANLARNLGKKLKKENRNMTKEEAYIQLGHSASLFKGILNFLFP